MKKIEARETILIAGFTYTVIHILLGSDHIAGTLIILTNLCFKKQQCVKAFGCFTEWCMEIRSYLDHIPFGFFSDIDLTLTSSLQLTLKLKIHVLPKVNLNHHEYFIFNCYFPFSIAFLFLRDHLNRFL